MENEKIFEISIFAIYDIETAFKKVEDDYVSQSAFISAVITKGLNAMGLESILPNQV